MTVSIDRRTLLLAGAAALTPVITKQQVRAQDDVETLLKMAAERMAALVSFHFAMETIDGRSTIMENLELTSVSGDVVRPDSFRASVTARLAIVDVTVDIVSIGGRVWVTDPLQSGEVWQQIETGNEGGGGDASFTDLINPDRLFLLAITYIEEPAIEGTEQVNGEDCTVVSGTFVPSRLQDMASPIAEEGPAPDPSSLLADEPVYLTAWIAADGRVFRMEEAGPLTSAESNDVIRRLEFSNFDGDIEITEPTVA